MRYTTPVSPLAVHVHLAYDTSDHILTFVRLYVNKKRICYGKSQLWKILEEISVGIDGIRLA